VEINENSFAMKNSASDFTTNTMHSLWNMAHCAQINQSAC